MTAPDPVELQQEIEQTRERLGETAGELAAQADVLAVAAAGVVLVGAIVAWRLRRP